uniref:Uncharacterized protein n=1 Tax=Setaria viridis TaxID=4556 RepID=A0A4U6UFV5_SETVI|nr:hypothetical protein SEVIR_5G151800v2 [Setaria viridis]
MLAWKVYAYQYHGHLNHCDRDHIHCGSGIPQLPMEMLTRTSVAALLLLGLQIQFTTIQPEN